MKKRIGQITTKKIGSKYASCISGTPQRLFSSLREAQEDAIKLRTKFGIRNYNLHKRRRKR